MSTNNFDSNQKLRQQNNAQTGKYTNTMRNRQLTLYNTLWTLKKRKSKQELHNPTKLCS